MCFFSLGGGEKIDVKDNSIDLVTVAQALHWIKVNLKLNLEILYQKKNSYIRTRTKISTIFQVDKFYEEVKRILKPGL